MASNILKISMSFIAATTVAFFVAVVLVNSSVSQTKWCSELYGARVKRDADKVLRREVKNKKIRVEKVFLKKAKESGAMCLDGTPPGYHFREGFEKGVNKWVIFFNGGAWCFDEQACFQRSHTAYGSSRINTRFSEDGLYSSDQHTNPAFHNWNMVFVIYCDGSSFTGMRQDPVYFGDKPVYFRGKAILEAIIQDLLFRGVRYASDVLLSGSSAGSLALLIHADFIKSRLNPKTKVRVIADSGYFVDLETQYGTNKTRVMFQRMLFTHNSTSSLHPGCIKRMPIAQHWKCFFPQYFFHLIETPVFVLQSAYDVWQIVNNLDIVCTIPSYKELLLFRSLALLSWNSFDNLAMRPSENNSRGNGSESRKTIKASQGDSHASHDSNRATKISQWRTRKSARTRNIFPIDPSSGVTRVKNVVPRVQHASNPGHVESHVNRYPTITDTFRNTPVFTSPMSSVSRTSRWRNILGTRGFLNKPAFSRDVNLGRLPNNPLYAQVSSPSRSSVRYQVTRQQNLMNAHAFPIENTREITSAAHLPYANQVPVFTQNTEPNTYSITNLNVAHFRKKREPENNQLVLPGKSRNISANVAQFKRPKRGVAQSMLSESRNDKKQNLFKMWHWQALYSRPTSCTKDETEKILNFRKSTIEALKPVMIKPHAGLFLSPCFEHTQATSTRVWRNTKVEGKSPRDAIAEWYFEKPGAHIYIGAEFEFSSCTT